MKLVHAWLSTACLALGAFAAACGTNAPRMTIASSQVRAGESVVVRFDAPPVAPRSRGDVWLSLVPVGSSEEFVGERVVIDEGAGEATVPAGEEGTYELRLVDESPRRLSRVVSRMRVEVERAAAAHNEPPAWYW
ncbi:MAG: hypothetical protein JWP87_6336 [Labilithrix sp.]|nr:hypothetical protein [Labilithrix sp.]